jgi:hypothetical protein
MLAKLVGRLALGHHGLDARATTILSDMTPASSGDQGPDMPRPLLDCGPYANQVRSARHARKQGGGAVDGEKGGGGRGALPCPRPRPCPAGDADVHVRPFALLCLPRPTLAS